MSTPTLLDTRLTASKARVSADVRSILTRILKEAIVVVHGKYHYRVDFGPDVQPRYHTVSWELACTCRLGEDCPAVTAVKKYLQDGGKTAKTPEPGYWPTIPHKCPVCAGVVHYDPQLSSKRRGLGWRCESDKSHYWTHQGQALAKNAKGTNVAAFYAANAFPFSKGYDPNREYPEPVCRHCGQPD